MDLPETQDQGKNLQDQKATSNYACVPPFDDLTFDREMTLRIGLITVFDAILMSSQRLRRRNYRFLYILCKKIVNEANASDIFNEFLYNF